MGGGGAELMLVYGGRLGLRVPTFGGCAVQFFFSPFLGFLCAPPPALSPPPPPQVGPSAAVAVGPCAPPGWDVWQGGGGLVLWVPMSGGHVLPRVPTCGVPHTHVKSGGGGGCMPPPPPRSPHDCQPSFTWGRLRDVRGRSGCVGHAA